MWEPARHYAFAKIPNHAKDKSLTICNFVPGEKTMLCVISSDGSFYTFNVGDEGGECMLKREESIMDPEEE
jgi:hypothetical protein